MTDRSCLCVVLAAGEGTRMNSALPKVLHPLAGLPLVVHVMRAAQAAGGDVALVAGHGAEAVVEAVRRFVPDVENYVQESRLGTAHAVLSARPALERGYDDLLVVFGDTPLLEAGALMAARVELAGGADVVVMGFHTNDPHGYGRLIMRGGQLVAIREDRDCSDEERRITFCNGGLMAFSGAHALALLDAIGNANAKGEYYMTDAVAIAHARGLKVAAVDVSYDNVLGINTRAELAEAEAVWQRRRRRAMMLSGVTLLDPATVYFSHDTEIGRDTVIEPNVWFGPGVKVGEGVSVHAFSHIEGTRIAAGCSVGPFARLRPGADLAEGAKVGNFCEVKQAEVGPGAKINHLTYIGDASVGAKANIGAGTITCNYDGFAKHRTEIGAGAFIGSNSALVAPVRIGEGAYVSTGSVVTEDVPDDGLAFGRARQVNKEGRGRALRQRLAEAAAARRK